MGASAHARADERDAGPGVNEALATWIVHVALLYAAIGVVFGIAFAFRGAGRVDL